MGSLRNPIGPLPSSIYWRRRAVLLSVVALLALLIVWIVTLGGGGGNNGANGSGGKSPTESITPGPSGTGPAISEHPGGRDESGGSGGSGSGSGSGGSGGSGAGSGGSDDAAGGDSGDGGGSGGGNGSGGTSSGDQVPAGSSLPDCTAGGVTLKVRSVHNSYAPGDKPKLQLVAKNTADKSCKVDLGPKTAVVTITKAEADKPFWSSDDCPAGAGGMVLRAPAGGTVQRDYTWDLRPSEPQCATPSAGVAGPGTYLVEVKAAQLPAAQTSFVLKKD
ncbi:hypothetical protein OG785_20400 [Streptomyces sp. NBC_00006]|uniref:hypothetical protein n=1 Tax=unclassified Streptomyces TaxID=2593676 RepID=UPI00224E18CC|nr:MULTISPECIES: hypothetical protein [unclassified Streptomyces]MCX4827698.1 hypothetical protein [Streptomyces sp. NBC_01016]MCX5532908.1 hypothetical protein [Streptomyces sp. NBC_00006]